MKVFSKEELAVILEKHSKWLNTEEEGERADLSRADLSRADLSGANLSRANLSEANLSRANLFETNLSRANLFGANLSGANLFETNLFRANLSRANLFETNLSGANLFETNLSKIKNGEMALAMTMVPADGDIIGWKKCFTPNGGTCIIKLLIPSEAKRSSATTRKCRAEWAKIMEVIGADIGLSSRDRTFQYKAGEIVRPDSWDDNRLNECSHGIHFFITRTEAEAFDL